MQEQPIVSKEPDNDAHQFYLVDGGLKQGFDHIGDLMDAVAEAAIGPIENGDTFTVEIKHDTDHGTSPKTTVIGDQLVKILTSYGPDFHIRIPAEVIVNDYATDIYSFVEEHLRHWESWRFPEENAKTEDFIKIYPEVGPAFYAEVPANISDIDEFLNTYFKNVDSWEWESES